MCSSFTQGRKSFAPTALFSMVTGKLSKWFVENGCLLHCLQQLFCLLLIFSAKISQKIREIMDFYRARSGPDGPGGPDGAGPDRTGPSGSGLKSGPAHP